MTAPELRATLNASAIEFFAAVVVLPLPMVAIRIPMNPEAIEITQPSKNEIAV